MIVHWTDWMKMSAAEEQVVSKKFFDCMIARVHSLEAEDEFDRDENQRMVSLIKALIEAEAKVEVQWVAMAEDRVLMTDPRISDRAIAFHGEQFLPVIAEIAIECSRDHLY